jgi:LysR family hydrogen peroxide-inducible transcriptional activator
MQLSQLSLRDLEYVLTVAETLHFNQAALKLGVSQPTLSEQIKKLETMLDIKIFERTNRLVKITSQAQPFLNQAQKVLQEATQLINISKQSTSPLSSEFKLGVIATVAPYYLPYIIKPLKKAYPKLQLLIQEGHTDELLRDLSDGKLNAVIASRTFDENSYRLYSLYHEPFVFASSLINKEKNEKPISIKQIDLSNLILLTDGNCFKDEVLNFCRMTKNNSTKLQATGLETLQHLIASDNGTALIPKFAISHNKKLKSLINYQPFVEKNAQREIVLISREQYSNPNEIRLLAQILKRHIPN